jgi:PAS domain S-box-containing protein
VMLPLLIDNTSWKAFVEFLRTQMELVELTKEAKQEMTNRVRKLVRANQELKSIVAERKRAEERLSQLASIIEFANDAIVIYTLGSTIVSWNKGAENIYGYSASEVLGRSRYMLVPPDQLDETHDSLERLTREETIQLCDAVHIRKDGKRINVSMTASPVKDVNGKIVGAAAITRDISDRKEAEERFYKAFDANPEPITIATLADDRYIDVNESFLRLIGYSREEVIGRTSREIKFGDRATLIEALKKHGSVRDLECTFLTKSGERRTGLYSAKVIDIAGQRCMLTIFKDITDHKVLGETTQARRGGTGVARR